jgi:hypothetical protein
MPRVLPAAQAGKVAPLPAEKEVMVRKSAEGDFFQSNNGAEVPSRLNALRGS